MIAEMSSENRTLLASYEERERAALHLGYGMYLRNHLGLWGDNEPLLRELGCWVKSLSSFEEQLEPADDPDWVRPPIRYTGDGDRASGIILAAMVQRLRRTV